MKRSVIQMVKVVFAVAIALLPLVQAACSGGASNAEGENSLSVVPPGNEEPKDGDDETAEGGALALTSEIAYVFYQQDSTASTECDFIRPFELQVSGTTATFREREESAQDYTVSAGGFWIEIEDEDSYTCYVALLDANSTASLTCYDTSGGQCEALFSVDSDAQYQLAATTFETSTSTSCPDFPSEVSVGISGNRASLTMGSASAVTYVLTGAQEFTFSYGTGTANAHGSVVDNSFVGYVYNFNNQVGQSCTFAATTTSITAPPATSPGTPSTPATGQCGGALSTWYGPCMRPPSKS